MLSYTAMMSRMYVQHRRPSLSRRELVAECVDIGGAAGQTDEPTMSLWCRSVSLPLFLMILAKAQWELTLPRLECVKILCEHYWISSAALRPPTQYQAFLLLFSRLVQLVTSFFLRYASPTLIWPLNEPRENRIQQLMPQHVARV